MIVERRFSKTRVANLAGLGLLSLAHGYAKGRGYYDDTETELLEETNKNREKANKFRPGPWKKKPLDKKGLERANKIANVALLGLAGLDAANDLDKGKKKALLSLGGNMLYAGGAYKLGHLIGSSRRKNSKSKKEEEN